MERQMGFGINKINTKYAYYVRTKFIPIVFFEIFLTAILVLFAFGPWNWPVNNPYLLYSYLICAQIALYIGYRIGLQRPIYRKVHLPPLLLIKLGTILNFSLAIPLIYVRSGGNLSYAWIGLFDPGLVYDLSRQSEIPYNVTEYIEIVFSPITWSLLPWLIFYWSSLTRRTKIIGILSYISAGIMPYIASGTNKGIFDLFLLIFSLKILILFVNPPEINQKIRKQKRKIFIGATVVFILISVSFSKNIAQRYGDENFLEKMSINTRAEGITVSPSFMESSLPIGIKAFVIAISSYLTQGYYGCSLALNQPFVPTYGFGNSKFFSWLIGEKILGIDMQPLTYTRRVGMVSSWEPDITWSSIYPWFASDFTFFGALLIVLLIGYLLAQSWVAILLNRDPWAVIIFSLLCIMIFYFSANNQIFQTGPTFVTFFVALIAWKVKRRI